MSSGLQPGVCFKVERIIDYKEGGSGNSSVKCYQVIWAPTWVSSANLVGCQDLIDQFFNDGKSSQEENRSSSNDDTVVLDSSGGRDAIRDIVSAKIEDHGDFDRNIVDDNRDSDLRRELRKKHKEQCIHQLKQQRNQLLQNKQCSSIPIDSKKEDNDSPLEIYHLDGDRGESSIRTDGWTTRSPENQHNDIPISMVPRYLTQREGGVENMTNTSKTPPKNHQGKYELSPSKQHIHILLDTNNNLHRSNDGAFTVLLKEEVDLDPAAAPPTTSVDTTCKYCNKTFSNKCNLKRHIMTHTGEKPHVCSVCSKAFSNIQYLTHHMRTHTGEKPYQCSVCEKAFSQRSSLTAHERLHSGERPYKCSICKKTFVDNSGLRSHLKRIHNMVS